MPLVAATALAWVVIAVVRHLRFGSTLYDLGIFDQIVWNTSHGRPFLCSIHVAHFLGDHFGPAVALLAPLYWVAPSPMTLLFVDVACVVAATVPLFRAARAKGLSEATATWVVAIFLAYPTTTCIAVYDFHPDMLALPWLMFALYFEATRRLGLAALAVAIAVACKEEYAVWCAVFGVFVALRHRGSTGRAVGAGLALGAAVYLAIVLTVVMPAFNPAGVMQLGRYAYLGHGPREVLVNVARNPLRLTWALTPIKLLHWVLALAALAFYPLRAPRYLVLAVPTWAYNLLSTHENQSFLHYQNMVPLLPPLFFCVIDVLAGVSERAGERGVARARLPLALLAPANLAFAAFFQWYLWVRYPEPAPAAVGAVAARLPAEASLSTSNALGAHFAERRWLTMFPSLRPIGAPADVDFILLWLGPGSWRYLADGPAELAALVREAERHGYAPVEMREDVVLLGREGRAMPTADSLDAELEEALRVLEAPAPPRPPGPG